MGVETALITTMMASSLYGGYQQAKQNKENAKATVTEAQLTLQKQAKQAEVMKKNASILASKQKVSFLNSGTTLEGNPYDVIGDTFSNLESDLTDLKSDIALTGASYYSKAKAYNSGARSSLLSGIGSAAGTGAMYGYNAGWFQKSDSSFLNSSMPNYTSSSGKNWSVESSFNPNGFGG